MSTGDQGNQAQDRPWQFGPPPSGEPVASDQLGQPGTGDQGPAAHYGATQQPGAQQPGQQPGAQQLGQQPGPQPFDGYAQPQRRPSAGIGWLLLAPAVILLVIQQVFPAVSTFVSSFRAGSDPSGGGSFVGAENFSQLVGMGWFQGALLAAVAGLVPAVAGYLIGVVLGQMFGRAPRTARVTGLSFIAAALVTLAPTTLAFVYVYTTGLTPNIFLLSVLLWLGPAMMVGAVIGALASVDAPRGLLLGYGGAIAACAGLALGVQTSFGIIGIGQTVFPSTVLWRSVATFQLGLGAASAVLLMPLLMILGLITTSALLRSGLRIRIAPTADAYSSQSAPAPSGGNGILAGVIVLVASLATVAIIVFPMITEDLSARAPGGPAGPGQAAGLFGYTFVETWVLGGVGVVVSLVIAAAAGLGLGYYRPIGDRSLSLGMWFFSPWLFVGVLPLLSAHVSTRIELGALGTVWGSLPPQLLVVPILFVAIYLGDALHQARAAAPASSNTKPLLAALGLLGVVLLMLRTEDLLWDVTARSESAIAMAYRYAFQHLDPSMIFLTRPWPILLVLGALAVLCAVGMGRLRVVATK